MKRRTKVFDLKKNATELSARRLRPEEALPSVRQTEPAVCLLANCFSSREYFFLDIFYYPVFLEQQPRENTFATTVLIPPAPLFTLSVTFPS
jgi:hypothetical protein